MKKFNWLFVLVPTIGAFGLGYYWAHTQYGATVSNAETLFALGELRNAIAREKDVMVQRCGATPHAWPPVANLRANSITSGNIPCTNAQVPETERQFLRQIPKNAWGNPDKASHITDCTPGNCVVGNGLACDGKPFNSDHGGWCYNPATGRIWANSAQNGRSPAAENTY